MIVQAGKRSNACPEGETS